MHLPPRRRHARPFREWCLVENADPESLLGDRCRRTSVVSPPVSSFHVTYAMYCPSGDKPARAQHRSGGETTCFAMKPPPSRWLGCGVGAGEGVGVGGLEAGLSAVAPVGRRRMFRLPLSRALALRKSAITASARERPRVHRSTAGRLESANGHLRSSMDSQPHERAQSWSTLP